MSWPRHVNMTRCRHGGDGRTQAIGAGSAKTARYKNTTGPRIYDAFHQSFHTHLTNPARLARQRIKVHSSKRGNWRISICSDIGRNSLLIGNKTLKNHSLPSHSS